jgi:hypothetical protein
MRDRRIAASEETVSVRGPSSRVYREGSVAASSGAHGARARGGRAARYDREPSAIRAVILHQTAGSTFLTGRAGRLLADASGDGSMSSDSRLDRVAAHFVVRQDGSIFYTHDVQYIIDSAGGRLGIDIEVAGSFPHSASPDPARRLPVEAIRALRTLLTALKQQLPTLTHIHPHGQVQTVDIVARRAVMCGGPGSANPCDKLASCPGPDIWVNVGQWACQPMPTGLGLTSVPMAPYQDNGIHPDQSNAAYDQSVV